MWTHDQEEQVFPQLREVVVGFVAYAPLGNGLILVKIRSVDELDDSDFRKTSPRLAGESFQRNQRIAVKVEADAAEAGPTPA